MYEIHLGYTTFNQIFTHLSSECSLTVVDSEIMDFLLCFTAPVRHHAHAAVCFPSVTHFDSLTFIYYNLSESDAPRRALHRLEMSLFFFIALTFEPHNEGLLATIVSICLYLDTLDI